VPFIWVIRPEVAKRGAHIKISETSERISVRSVDPTVKNYHWGDMTKALFEALDEGYDTTILLDEKGYVTEGPGFNIFMISGNRLLTPRSGMLEGISRRTVMEIGAELGMEVAATDITAEEFLAADEVFTATTGGGPVPVTRVNSTILGNDAIGEKTQGILDAYWDWHERPALSTPIVYPA
jgi:branched-chain amino acid aminotransferase